MATNDHLRTKEMAEKYDAFKASGGFDIGCTLCKKDSLHTFKFWKIILNDFPYDRIVTTHHMIIPLRHTIELELTVQEKTELQEIKNSKLQEYDIIVEATQKNKSIPAHFHLHLINTKPE